MGPHRIEAGCGAMAAARLRWGDFELDPEVFELTRRGLPVKLERIPSADAPAAPGGREVIARFQRGTPEAKIQHARVEVFHGTPAGGLRCRNGRWCARAPEFRPHSIAFFTR